MALPKKIKKNLNIAPGPLQPEYQHGYNGTITPNRRRELDELINEDGTGTEDGTKDGTGDGTGDGLGEKGLFANLGGKGAKDPLGKFESVSIVDPVAPVSAADMYRRPQYITKSLFSEYFK